MDRNAFFRKHLAGRRWAADLAMLPILGAAAYLLFRAGLVLTPAEGAVLLMVTAALILVGRRWLAWQRDLVSSGFLTDWAHRILNGERERASLPQGLPEESVLTAAALNTLLGELGDVRGGLKHLEHAAEREWVELDRLLAQAGDQQALDRSVREQAMRRLEAFGKDLRGAIEGTLRFDQIELNHRLRADQHRLQGQAFRASLEQVQAGLEEFEDMLQELRDTFPRLRREEDALGQLADASIRQSAGLGLSVKGLVAHAPRLLEEARERSEQLRRFRRSADGLRDQAEALTRRMEAFRDESQVRIRSFGGAQGSLRIIDQAAQQTGLLAVNAAILAQQGGGEAGMQAIGGRLRTLAEQTSEGASDLERALDEHQRQLERENTGLWDLQEVTQGLTSGIQELLRSAEYLSLQGQDMERALESHIGLAEQVRIASERAERSLQEVRERAAAIESALERQWGVEAKLAPERERLSRVGSRLVELGDQFVRISQQNVDGIWEILGGHQEIRRSEAYHTITSGGLGELLGETGAGDPPWNRLAWARSQRRSRLLAADRRVPPTGWQDAEGELHLELLTTDALDQAEPSAIEAWTSDPTGRVWHLRLIEPLRTESHRLSLLESLKVSPLGACLPGIDLRISPDGADLILGSPYPGFPAFLAGLGLTLPVGADTQIRNHRVRLPNRRHAQRLLWIGPNVAQELRNDLMRLVHMWVRDDHRHESFMPWLSYEGHRPPCPWLAEGEVTDSLEGRPEVCCLGLDADPAALHPFRDRLLQAGATEGTGGAVLGVVALTHDHPEALLLRLFQTDAGMAGAPHPDLVPFQARLREEVLAYTSADPYAAGWQLLEDLQRKGWALPLPPE